MKFLTLLQAFVLGAFVASCIFYISYKQPTSVVIFCTEKEVGKKYVIESDWDLKRVEEFTITNGELE